MASIIERLAGRDDLTTAEVQALAAARRAAAPATERFDRDGWTVQISHHAHTGGHWSAIAWRAGTCYESEYCLASGASEAEARAAVERFFEAADMDSLDPLDVGFDLRTIQMAVTVPYPRASVRVRLARSKKHPEGKVLEGHSMRIVHALHEAGYQSQRAE